MPADGEHTTRQVHVVLARFSVAEEINHIHYGKHKQSNCHNCNDIITSDRIGRLANCITYVNQAKKNCCSHDTYFLPVAG